MARRRKNKDLASVLVLLPWWMSGVMGVAAFAAIRWLFPLFFSGNPILAALAIAMRPLAWLALVFFAALAVVSAMRQPHRASNKTGKAVTSSAPEHRLEPLLPNAGGTTLFVPSNPSTWSLQSLQSLEWKRFEHLCAWYYDAFGLTAETLAAGPDGGIDIKLFKPGNRTAPIAIVQCKAWQKPVGVALVRELLGVMTHEKVKRGIFITTANYTDDATAFAATNQIQLVSGVAFVAKLQALDAARQKDLLERAFSGDYATPTCASCGVKMVSRASAKGAFWGCINFPKCRTMLNRRAGTAEASLA
ncbi:MAG: putative restriction endonuclease [Herminiimonas sp.]|nr:putative restriction endonuclease [Herminiimonas sp.]MDB5854169.1 putative restriction endonuclease [Herminiimonas sp.]